MSESMVLYERFKAWQWMGCKLNALQIGMWGPAGVSWHSRPDGGGG